MEKTANSY